MHLALANQWYLPESGWGGVAMWNYAMAHAYRALGDQVTVVASRIGGIPETVDDGVNGLLVEPGNAAELAEAIGRLARDPAVRERMGSAGREKVVREFDPIRVARQNLKVYEQAKRTFQR